MGSGRLVDVGADLRDDRGAKSDVWDKMTVPVVSAISGKRRRVTTENGIFAPRSEGSWERRRAHMMST